MKKVIAMLVLGMMAISAVALAVTPKAECNLCGCRKYQEGLKKHICVCGHSEGVHRNAR